MQKTLFKVILILCLTAVCVSGVFFVKQILQRPFRSVNDALHETDSPLTLDFIIPGGCHLDEKITIGEVLRLHFSRQPAVYESTVRTLAGLMPVRYQSLTNLFLFLLWTFLFLTFFRVFTFLRYGLALRLSLLLGGAVYYFMPDFSPGKTDDNVFIGGPLLIIVGRAYFNRKASKKKA
jgi:hypothetical protein